MCYLSLLSSLLTSDPQCACRRENFLPIVSVVKSGGACFPQSRRLGCRDDVSMCQSSSSLRKPPPLGLSSGLLGRLQSLVLLLAPPLRDQHANDRHATSDDNGTATCLIVRLLIPQEEVWREPMADGRHAVGVCDQRRTLGSWTWYHGRLPRDLELLKTKVSALCTLGPQLGISMLRDSLTLRPTKGPVTSRNREK